MFTALSGLGGDFDWQANCFQPSSCTAIRKCYDSGRGLVDLLGLLQVAVCGWMAHALCGLFLSLISVPNIHTSVVQSEHELSELSLRSGP